MWLTVEHVTQFSYDAPVTEAYTELRLKPAHRDGQRCSSFSLVPEPRGVTVTLISPGFIASEIRQVDNLGVHHPRARDPMPAWLVMPAEVAARKIVAAAEAAGSKRFITGEPLTPGFPRSRSSCRTATARTVTFTPDPVHPARRRGFAGRVVRARERTAPAGGRGDLR